MILALTTGAVLGSFGIIALTMAIRVKRAEVPGIRSHWWRHVYEAAFFFGLAAANVTRAFLDG